MAPNDDLFDDLWDDAPKQDPPQTNSSSNQDWDFLSDGSPPPQKKPSKKKGGILWLILAALLVVGIMTRLPAEQDSPQPTPPVQTTPTPPTQPSVPDPARIPYRYLYQRLSSQEQALFTQVLAGLSNADGSIGPLNFPDKQSIGTVMEAVWYDCPEVFWYDGSYTYSYYDRPGCLEVTLTPNYHWSKQQCMQNKAFVEQTLQPLIARLSALSDYDKVMGVHEYLVDNTAYTPSYRGTTFYETLPDGKAVCEGYARATQYLMNQLNIPVIYVSGAAVNSAGVRDSHSWNLVQVEGQWYLLDVTWDDPYFTDGTQQKLYTYFCVTTEEMNRNHTPDLNIFPDCTATAANYYVRQGRYLSAYDTATLQSWLAASAESKTLSLKCANKTTYEQVLQLLSSSGFHDLAQKAQVSVGSYNYQYDDVFYTITVKW